MALLPLILMTNRAGPPTPAEGDFFTDERINLSAYLGVRSDGCYLIRVEDEGIVEAGIHLGDLLVVEKGAEANVGDVVIILHNGQLVITRLFEAHHGSLRLVPDTATLKTSAEPDVWGIVKFAIHRVSKAVRTERDW